MPSDNAAYIKAIRRIFELYTEVSLSRRAISKRLNEEGLCYYDRPWTHSLVTGVLENPAYAGDTHFGKTKSADFYTFDATGAMTELNGRSGKPKAENAIERRSEDERIIKEDTHEPLTDRKTWERAKAKLTAEREHTSFAPQNPRYYLKNLLVCGHCGQGMTGRTDNGRVTYVCRTYANGLSNGQKVSCGYHTIKHDLAEQMLIDKIKEQDLEFDQLVSAAARENVEERLTRLGYEDDATATAWQQYIDEGMGALATYMSEEYGVEYPEILKVREAAWDYYCGEGADEKLRADIAEVEAAGVNAANARIDQLKVDVERYTLAYMEATGMQRDILKRKADEAEAEIEKWQPRTVRLHERFEELFEAEKRRKAERVALMNELPMLEYRERGEAFRRLFVRVELYWDAEWVPARKDTKRKTNRKGRYKYTLRHDLTQWTNATTNLGGSW